MIKGVGTEVGFSLGSNVGDKAETIRRAFATLEAEGVVSGLVRSKFYRTAPWGPVAQDWFVNVCAFGVTTCSPADLLVRIKRIEKRLGRVDTVRWGPRVIDIDILYYGTKVIETPGLTLPHKEILRRAFVLVPLAEIRPDLVIGDTTVRIAAEGFDPAGVVPLPMDSGDAAG